MQRLANMANRVLPAAVLVQKAATRCEIEQREADQHCAVTAQCVLIRNAELFEKRTSHVFYKATSTLPDWTAETSVRLLFRPRRWSSILDRATILP
jgi:hypothetical protein